jgi:sugar/nucleoside kinase (ribokinase family)
LPDVLVVGEINPDIVVSDPDPVPVFGQVERLVESIGMTIGSSSAIFACAAAKLGLEVSIFGTVGADAFGQFMLKELARHGVDTSPVIVDPARSTGASVIMTRGADRAIITATGAIGDMEIDALPPSILGRAGHVHSAAFFLQSRSHDRLPAFFATCRARGLTTSFDPNFDPAEAWDGGVHEMLAVADLFFPNATEACRIAGADDPLTAGLRLARAAAGGRPDGGPTVVVKLGADGACACRPDGSVTRVPALPIVAVDSTGAGDTFDAAFLRAWLEGRPLRDCLRWGAAAGALSTLALGGVDAQPDLDGLRAALEAWVEPSERVDAGARKGP